MDKRVDAFLERATRWQEEFKLLRNIVLGCGLDEDLKWGKPCYTYKNSNIVIIQGFREYCALLFFKGSLLKNAGGILIKTGENTQAGRQARFTGTDEILKLKDFLRACVFEAVEVEKAGLKVNFKKTPEFKVPEEFRARLHRDPSLESAFHSLTPGRQRAYILFFSQPKQSSTRESRIDRCTVRILSGKGLND